MSKIICHNNGRYNIYSTIVDDFCFKDSLSLEQLKSEIKDESGKQGLRHLDARIERAHKNGHSSYQNTDLDGFLCCNHAGVNGSFLTTDDCIDKYLS